MEIKETSHLHQSIDMLGALAQEHRLSVFRLLVQTGCSGLAAGTIAERLDVPRSSLSFHLTNLKAANLVAERREGRSIIYTANFAAMRDLIAFLLQNCCAGDRVETALVEQLAQGEPG